METWWRVKLEGVPSVTPIDVIRSTEKCVFFENRFDREEMSALKETSFEVYFKTEEEAWDRYNTEVEKLYINDVKAAKRQNAEELYDALTAALEWIDHVPSETPLPAMPGFDRDWVNSLIEAVDSGKKLE